MLQQFKRRINLNFQNFVLVRDSVCVRQMLAFSLMANNSQHFVAYC